MPDRLFSDLTDAELVERAAQAKLGTGSAARSM